MLQLDGFQEKILDIQYVTNFFGSDKKTRNVVAGLFFLAPFLEDCPSHFRAAASMLLKVIINAYGCRHYQTFP